MKQRHSQINNLVGHLCFKASKATLPGGRFRNRMEKRLVRRIKRIFDHQLLWVLKEAEKLPAFKQSARVKFYTKKEISQDVNLMLEGLPMVEDMTDDIVLVAGVTMLKGGKSQIRKLKLGKVGITFSLNHPEAVEYLESIKELQLSNYKGSISKVTKDRIKKLLVDGANEGTPYTEIAKQITKQGKSGVFSQARGELISTREIGFAYAKGERTVVDDFVQETGATMEKNWLTAGDGRVRERHMLNEKAGWIPIDEVFPGTSEDQAPSGEFGCRCVTSFREV